MTRPELQSLGLDDALLAREYQRIYGKPLVLPKQDTLETQATRRDAFNAVCSEWYKESGS